MNRIECFVRSAEAGSFSEAARRLSLTSAAVGKNVAKLEANLGVRLFQRSTRSLKLTEAGERFLQEVSGGLGIIQSAVSNLASADGQPAGTLKVSMGTGFGRTYIVPMLKDFMQRFPAIAPDWHFDNRRVDLVAEGFDVAIGGGFELPPGMVARTLGPAHGVLVAAPDYFSDKTAPTSPTDLDKYNGILIRSPQTGRVRSWPLQHRAKQTHEQAPVALRASIIVSDPDAACEATQQGLGIALVSMPNALRYLEQKKVVRVLPDWYVDMGTVSLYFAGQKLLPAKTRAFVDYVVEQFREQNLAKRFSAF